ncbi:hypothetical protein [Gilvibacter sediminis]|uniref:hypothetical protein n=1 Tax=Gilvibacter sediminis TaxID=379071 RepID=UPI0023506D25|nr:hypothetical protein [Gilvibacter sediminis]MDC7998013.1 hypothetical protein [Gilvibacter sediminis]
MKKTLCTLFALIGFLFYANGQAINDTITNWQLYKDSELILKSHDFNSVIQEAEIETSEEFSQLIVRVNYDTRVNDVFSRRLWFRYDEVDVLSVQDIAKLEEPLILSKEALSEVLENYLRKPITVFYQDASRKHPILIGILNFK